MLRKKKKNTRAKKKNNKGIINNSIREVRKPYYFEKANSRCMCVHVYINMYLKNLVEN